MRTNFWRRVLAGALLLPLALGCVVNAKEVYTDPADAELPVDFKIQGEYEGEVEGGAKLGVQIIALGGGAFQAVVLPGGLPGAGWDGKTKRLLDGRVEGEAANFKPAEGKKQYLAAAASDFSATSDPNLLGNPYAGVQVGNGYVLGKTTDGKAIKLGRVIRKSPTLGAKPPEGAVVLFDGTNRDEWTAGRLDEKTKLLNTDGGDILTKKKFNNFTMHLEFMLPYRPAARGQGRGNSGFYLVDHYEAQVLDSFGLDGKNNECGGIYQLADPLVNMCLPPLQWQTYDAEFTNAKQDGGKQTEGARLTLKHNGVVVHDNLLIEKASGGSRTEPTGTPGPIKLQGHGNPLQYRNIWVVEKK